ncbi:hypothetical protein SVAN01_05252 [Stagonosporopsis vannaccii]|nr:hypothetical protein SVAN01_05252 [Stagonosporopsis vannaccii]
MSRHNEGVAVVVEGVFALHRADGDLLALSRGHRRVDGHVAWEHRVRWVHAVALLRGCDQLAAYLTESKCGARRSGIISAVTKAVAIRPASHRIDRLYVLHREASNDMATNRNRALALLITPNKPYEDFLTWIVVMLCLFYQVVGQVAHKHAFETRVPADATG